MKVVEQGLYSLLSNDATLSGYAPGGVWRNLAPFGVAGVVVTFGQQSSVDTYTFSQRAMVDMLYQVKAIAPGESAATAWDAGDRIDALLTDGSLTISSGSVLRVRRQSSISLTETDGGEMFQHVGGIYAITVQE